MKKLLAVTTLVLTLAANAAWEKVGVLQIADVTSLVRGITKIGEFTGDPMLGLQASMGIMQLPCVNLFGPGREGVPFALSLLWDKKHEYAILYPIAKTQAEFLQAHPGTVGADGIIELKPDDEDDEDRFVKFSADGKWVAFSDKKDQLDVVLQDIKLAERPMKGDLARLVIGKKGMDVFRKTYAEAKDGSGKKRQMEMVSDAESLVIAATVDDKGLSARGTVKAREGSKLAQCGLKSLADDPLAFAGKDALIASAVAADCGQAHFDTKEILALLAKHGIKTDFLAIDEKEDVTRMTLDIPAAVTYFKAQTNLAEKVTLTSLTADVEKTVAGQDTFKVENPAMAYSLAVKGYATGTTPSARLKAVLPEIAGKKPYNVLAFSLYATIKAAVPHVLNAVKPDERATVEPILAAMPAAGNGGIATAAWRDKDAHKFVARISADEFKCVSATFSAIMAYQMQKMMSGMSLQGATPAVTTDDDEDDDDED